MNIRHKYTYLFKELENLPVVQNIQFNELCDILEKGLPQRDSIEFIADIAAYEKNVAMSTFFHYTGKAVLSHTTPFENQRKRYHIRCGDVSFSFSPQKSIQVSGPTTTQDCGGIRQYGAEIFIPLSLAKDAVLVISSVKEIKY